MTVTQPDYLDHLREILKDQGIAYVDVAQRDPSATVDPLYTAVVSAPWLLALIDNKYPPIPVGVVSRKVTATLLNVRKGPNTDFGVIDQLPQGKVIQVDMNQIATNGFAPLYPPGQGWVSTAYLIPA